MGATVLIREILIASLLLSIAGAAPPEGGTAQGVPSAAADCAHDYLSHWKEWATEDPKFYQLNGLESSIATAELREPYRYYRLYPDDLNRYLASVDDDLLGFSSDTKYIFPIVSEKGTYLGALKLIRNRYDDGSPIQKGGDEFLVTGVRLRGDDDVTREVLQWRSAPSHSGTIVDFVQFGRVDLPGCLVLSQEDPEGQSIRLLPFQASRRAAASFARAGIAPTEPEELGKMSWAIKELFRSASHNK